MLFGGRRKLAHQETSVKKRDNFSEAQQEIKIEAWKALNHGVAHKLIFKNSCIHYTSCN